MLPRESSEDFSAQLLPQLRSLPDGEVWGRAEKLFRKTARAAEKTMEANEDRRKNWRMLQEMAGIEPEQPEPAEAAEVPA